MTTTTGSRPAALTSDAIDWRASTDEHPARMASMRSYSAVAKGDLEEWLTVYAEDGVVEDPVGPSMFDPEGKGHRGHAGIRAFWEQAIAPIDTFAFTTPCTSSANSAMDGACGCSLCSSSSGTAADAAWRAKPRRCHHSAPIDHSLS